MTVDGKILIIKKYIYKFVFYKGFTKYLLSNANSVFDPMHKTVFQNMDQPFNKYFIATSYNTYLVEDQVYFIYIFYLFFFIIYLFFFKIKGLSSIDGYISALKNNCRFIESSFKFFL